MSLLTALLHPREWDYERTRRTVASKWLGGSGIEIGALHRPFPAGADTGVSYLDRLDTSELRDEYPELNDQPLVDVDIRDDGETLATVENESCDFVVASHFLEHCQDPIGTLQNHLRVVRRGGIVLLALPDRRQGIDRDRPATTLEHLYKDHDIGPEVSRAEHYRQWAELIDLRLGNIPPDGVEAHAADLEGRGYSIHFHCWTAAEFRAQLEAIIERFGLQAEIVECRGNHHEFLVVLRRT